MPELHGATRLHLDAPPVYAPPEVPILSPRELPSVITAIFPNADRLEQLASRLDKTQRTFDLDTLFRLQDAAEPQSPILYWHTATTIALSFLVTVLIMYLFVIPHLKCFTAHQLPNQPEQHSPINVPEVTASNLNTAPQTD
jgi:hypothetical protein